MKNKRLFSALTNVDDKYIEEAVLQGRVKAKKRTIRRILGTVAACFGVAVVGINLWLFIPFSKEPPKMEKYADNEYYEVIYRINALKFSSSVYKNNYEKYIKGKLFNYVEAEDMVMEASPEAVDGSPFIDATGDSSNSSYIEVTDNQVAGIIESDHIKRTDTHIFYMYGNSISAYSIAGEQSEQVGSFTLDRGGAEGFFLSEDCNTIAVVTKDYKNGKYSTYVVTVDVSDPANMKEADEIVIDGGYFTSRLIKGELLLMTRFYAGNPDFDDLTTFVPHIGEEGNKMPIPMDGIIYPEKLTESNYTVVCKIDINTLELTDSSAFLSYSSNAYVSADYIFVARDYTNEPYERDDGWLWRDRMTEVTYITYDGFEEVNTVNVKGYIKDQYSLDQNDSILRIVTTTSSTKYKRAGDPNQYTADIAFINGTSASLYCIDIESGKIISSVVEFAPVGETVRSVRFDGESAYVCTAVQFTDPVFFFDLSDIKNITYKETGTIEGFSTSLINMGNGYLLGIGDGGQGLKLEIYTETPTGVESYCKHEYKFGYYSENYKTYYVNREEQIIGLGIYQKAAPVKSGYVVLHFDGTKLTEILYEEMGGSYEDRRGVYIDGYMYMFGCTANEDSAYFKVSSLQKNVE